MFVRIEVAGWCIQLMLKQILITLSDVAVVRD
jgi:hypothetical protein